MDFDRSKMYPGVPEYFDNDGRGLYSYLTGAASWYMLTMITAVYGVRGELGNMIIAPALMPEQYNENGEASVSLEFAGHEFDILVHDSDKKMPGETTLVKALCDGEQLCDIGAGSVKISKSYIDKLSVGERHVIQLYFE